MIPLSLAEIAELAGGRLVDVPDPAVQLTGPVVADSREPVAGGMFVAHCGERVDGHDFAGSAVAAGALIVLAARPLGIPAIVVEDDGGPVAALGRLARGVLERLPQLTVVGVTGSSGKTTTKDLLARVLGPLGSVVAAPRSYNTEISLPLTILRAGIDTRVLVLELGARGRGHIDYLCGIARPRVGVVLNVGAAHLGEFGSIEETAAAKGELVASLPTDGIAVLNIDDPRVAAMADRAKPGVRVHYYGRHPQAAVRAADVTLDQLVRPSFTLITPAGTARVTLNLHGAHQVSNALAAAATAHALGIGPTEIADLLEAATPDSPWRMEIVERADGVTVINDAYNANPDSMLAALEALAAVAEGRRSWAVLGEMRELGAVSAAAHEEIGRAAMRLGVTRIVAIGEGARGIHQGAVSAGAEGEQSVALSDAAAATTMLGREVRPGDVVLVKASRSIGLESMAAHLLAAPATPEGVGK